MHFFKLFFGLFCLLTLTSCGEKEKTRCQNKPKLAKEVFLFIRTNLKHYNSSSLDIDSIERGIDLKSEAHISSMEIFYCTIQIPVMGFTVLYSHETCKYELFPYDLGVPLYMPKESVIRLRDFLLKNNLKLEIHQLVEVLNHIHGFDVVESNFGNWGDTVLYLTKEYCKDISRESINSIKQDIFSIEQWIKNNGWTVFSEKNNFLVLSQENREFLLLYFPENQISRFEFIYYYPFGSYS